MDNKKKIIIITALITTSIFIIVLGVTYSFFMLKITDDTGSDVIVEAGTLRMVYKDTEFINFKNAKPGDTTSKTVTVHNQGNLPITYDFLWLALTNTYEVKSDLVMSVTCVSDKGTCNGYSQNQIADSGTNVPIITGNNIEPLETHTLVVTIMFLELEINQDDNQGKLMQGRLGVKQHGSYSSNGVLYAASDYLINSYESNSNEVTGLTKIDMPSTDYMDEHSEYRYQGSSASICENVDMTSEICTLLGGTSYSESSGCSNSSTSIYTSNLNETQCTTYGGNYQYGDEPSNYILFNDELWRIIGIMPTDDGTGVIENRLKIIKNDQIGKYAFDTTSGIGYDSTSQTYYGDNGSYGYNNWATSKLMQLLNEGYTTLSIGGSLYWNSSSGTCYSGNSLIRKGCSFTIGTLMSDSGGQGLNDAAKTMISNALWYTSGNLNYSDTNQGNNLATPSNIYVKERTKSNLAYGTNITLFGNGPHTLSGIKRSDNWIGKIGLISPSDFGYGSSICYNDYAMNSNIKGYTNDICKKSNWLYEIFDLKQGEGIWLMNPYYNHSSNNFIVNYTGGLNYRYAYSVATKVYPTTYLYSNAVIAEGNGSEEDPYILI